MNASTSARFTANASSTFQNVSLNGALGQYVWLRSSEPGTKYSFYVPGLQSLTYVNVQDSSACPATILATGGTHVDAGNNNCWTFPGGGAITISSASNQTFSYSQATTTISTITVTDASTPAITAANDIRIKIATATVNMRFDTTDTTATFGGSASGKVSNPVSYEGEGSVLVIPVDTNFSADDILTIDDLSSSQFLGVNTANVALSVYTDGVNDTVANDSDDKTVAIAGSLELSEHTAGQAENAFQSADRTDIEMFTFQLTPGGENTNITSITFSLTGIKGVETADLSNFTLHRDLDTDGVYDAGDTAVGGSGVVSISGQTGTISFTTPFSVTTAENFILVGSYANVTGKDAMSVSLDATDSIATGETTGDSVVPSGAISRVQHSKGGYGGGGGSASAVGGAPPSGDGIQTGGGQGGGDIDPNTGDTIGNEHGFVAPGSNSGSWTGGANAYDSDGVYTTATVQDTEHSFGSFGLTVPGGNQINGIAVKLEASGSTAAGTIGVKLSWNNGTTDTSVHTTATLSTTDGVYELGGESDTWGHTWTADELTDGSFTVEVVANPSSNTLRIDAIQVKVFHQATGGGGGGGGFVQYPNQGQYFANTYTAIGEALRNVLEKILSWFR